MFLNGWIFSRIVVFLSSPGAPHERFLSLLFTNTYFWIFMLFIVPIITMRLFAEERKTGTLEVLLTSPVSESDGRRSGSSSARSASSCRCGFRASSSSSTSAIEDRRGPRRRSARATSASSCSARTSWRSARSPRPLTKNQIVAAILAFAMLIPIFSAGLFESMARDPARAEPLGYFNIWDHMDEFARGVVDTRRLVYYLSGTALFLFLAATVLASKKETP